MYYVIGANGSQYGPVDEATVRAWVTEGRVAAQSLSFKTGESGWVPLQTRDEFRDLLAAGGSRSRSGGSRRRGHAAGGGSSGAPGGRERVARRAPSLDLPSARSASTASISATWASAFSSSSRSGAAASGGSST
jgi:hypothetical protein